MLRHGSACGLPSQSAAASGKPSAAGRPHAAGLAPLAVADHPLAPRHEGVAAHAVCGHTLLARDQRWAAACGWLLGERTARGQPEERQYHWSNLPVAATLDELAGYAHRRFAIEQFHEEAKGEIGLDQYQGRLWPGFHRHAATVTLAYSFLVQLELWQRHQHTRRGRPRASFSPSAGSA
jgi:hypothetical protein